MIGKFSKKSEQGFSLIEVMVALTFLTFIVTSGLSAGTTNLKTAAYFQNELIAVNLAQEGMELVRNIRDTGWYSETGDENLNCFERLLAEGRYLVSYDSSQLLSENGNPFLKKDSNGFYNYTNGGDTIFKRWVTIADTGGNGPGLCDTPEKKVVVEVTWLSRGQERNFVLENYLYNWAGLP